MQAHLTTRIKNEAARIGFDLVGITSAQPAARASAFRAWLEEGRHGDMAWLARDPEKRGDPARVLGGARSVVTVGLSYFVADPPPELWNDPLRGRVARYAWGRDYHDVMIPMLGELAAFIEKEAGRPVTYKTYVDTGPVLERDAAERAGLGFIGKNSLLINTRLGSYLFLGEIITDLELDRDGPVTEGTCGSCRRCQDICPTHAFPAPYIVDSNLCISYLTIELKGAIPEKLRPLMKNWIYGCDECQSVCPWVRQYSAPGRARFLNYSPDWAAPKLSELMALDDEAFREKFRGTPILRTKRRGLLRNVAVALGNSGQPAARPALEKAADDAEPMVREHVAWALKMLDGKT